MARYPATKRRGSDGVATAQPGPRRKRKGTLVQAIQDFYIASGAVVVGNVALAPGVKIWYGAVIRGDLGQITLGPRVNVQDSCILQTATDQDQTIEEGVVLGHGAVLHGRSVGRDTLVGIGARLLTGCEVGAECLIAAGTLVTEDRRIPARAVVMGCRAGSSARSPRTSWSGPEPSTPTTWS
jgi:carbonic anhydrase/acetyltransferase-like protein (isoleucine patch superfamily)